MAGDPSRFGLFAFLPLPDVDRSLTEIDYAFDTLKVDGIGMMTSYDTRWLGDPSLRPVLEALDRRKAVVFVHPRAPACCANLMPQVSPVEGALIEYPYDTGRTIMSLLLSGGLRRFPNIRWIFCHAGGTIPMLAGRIRNSGQVAIKNLDEIAPEGTDHELQRLFYDTAISGYAPTMAALLAFAPLGQVLYGTDSPFFEASKNSRDLTQIKLTPSQLTAIRRTNALKLFPRLA